MIPLLVEGLGSAFFPCSLVLLVPGVIVILGGGGQIGPGLAGFAASLVAVGWLRFTNLIEGPGSLAVGTALAAAATLATRPLWTNRPDSARTAVAFGLITGFAAASLWAPCVGPRFGALLTELPNRSVLGPLRLTAYVAGLAAPLVPLGSTVTLIPPRGRARLAPAATTIEAIALTLATVAIATGLMGPAISRLVAWSL